MNPSFVAEGSHLDALTLPLVNILNFKMLKALKGCKDFIRSYTIDDWILTYSHIPISYHFFLFLSTPSIRQPAPAVAFEERLQGVALAALAQGEAVGSVSPATIRHDARRAIRRVRMSKGGLKDFNAAETKQVQPLKSDIRRLRMPSNSHSWRFLMKIYLFFWPQMHGSLLIIQHSMLGVTRS